MGDRIGGVRGHVGVAVALAVVLAGCGALPGLAPTTTREPYSAPNVTVESDDLAPGLGEAGVVDARRLSSVHASTLAGRNYTLRLRTVQRYPNGTVRFRQNATGRFGGFGQTYEFVTSFSGARQPVGNASEATVHVWSGGRRILRATTVGGTTRYDGRRIENEYDRFAVNPTYQVQLYLLFDNLDTTVTDSREADNRTFYRVESTGVADAIGVTGALDVRTVENVSLVAWVSEDGVVHGYQVSYAGRRDDERFSVVTQVEFTRFGETAVDRPEWYRAAVETTGLD